MSENPRLYSFLWPAKSGLLLFWLSEILLKGNFCLYTSYFIKTLDGKEIRNTDA